MVNRNLYFKINHELRGPLTRSMGVPQGCVLSSMLYILYIIHIKRYIRFNNEIIKFADDTNIINKSKSIKKGLKNIETNIIQINQFFESIGLEMAPEKFQLIIFTKSQITKEKYHIKINNTEIYNVTKVKYFGIWTQN